MTRRQRAAVLLVLMPLILGGLLGGCARGGDLEPVGPQVVIDFVARYAGPINDAFYYFIAIDADGDFGLDGPLPVAAGPFWQNGWGTGSMTHYVEYHLGQYTVYRVNLTPSLRVAAGGIEAVRGIPDSTDVGTHALTVQSLTFGAVAVSGTGMISSAENNGLQAAGTIEITANAAGEIVAGGVVFTPAAVGGRPLIATEQAAVDALNTGGQPLAADSLATLGLTLVLSAPAAGTQELAVAPTVAQVRDVFTATPSGRTVTTQTTLTANHTKTAETEPLRGVEIDTGDLVATETAQIGFDISPTATPLGPPFDYRLPGGGDTLRVTLDLATLGENVPDLSVNFISTTELIFDPTITDPNLNTYDALGRLGNRYVTFRTTQFQTITNASGLFEQEQADDPTLVGPTTDEERRSVDLIDWSITVRRLR